MSNTRLKAETVPSSSIIILQLLLELQQLPLALWFRALDLLYSTGLTLSLLLPSQ